MSAADKFDRLAEVVAERHDLDQERDELIRALIADGARIDGTREPTLTSITGLSRQRIYQIRDGRR